MDVELAMQSARKTKEYRVGSSFDVPADAVESFTRAIVEAALSVQDTSRHTGAHPTL